MTLTDLPYLFGAAAGGFVLLAAIGIQALVALFSSLPLARRRKREVPDFDLKRAHRRILQVIILVTVLVAIITALVFHFGTTAIIVGYSAGMALAFLLSLNRLTPNNAQNQTTFAEAYADCEPPSAVNPDDEAQLPAQ